MRLFLGTYPHGQTDKRPEGIWSAELNLANGDITSLEQIAEVPAPSFIAFGRDSASILAVSEKADGEIYEFALTETGLEQRSHTRTRGADPCHLITCGEQTIVTNYSSGSVFAHRLPLQETVTEGSGQLFQQSGTGPDFDRQEGPHAHFAGHVPSSQYVWVTDLGADRIFRYVATTTPTGQAQLEARGTAVEFPAGAGPRHIAFADNSLAYVVGELDNRIYTVEIDEGSGSGRIIGAIDIPMGTVGAGTVDGAAGAGSLASHIELNAAQDLLFVTVRGADIIVAFEVSSVNDPEIQQSSNLSVVSQHSVVGTWPRHFRVIDGSEAHLLIVIANQGSSSLDVLNFDPIQRTFAALSSTEVPVPACVLADEGN